MILGLVGTGGFFVIKKNKDSIITEVAKKAIDYLPVPDGQEAEMATLTEIVKYFLTDDGRTYRILVMLQNNFELRPTGGFLGQFAILEIRNGQIVKTEIMDANIFDKQIKSDRLAPPPLAKYMGIKKWKFRDANWSPDFPTAVQDVLHFYGLKEENNVDFDAVFAINATILDDVLDITGPITVTTKSRQKGTFDVIFDVSNGAWTLQEAVEKDILLRDAAVERAEEEDEIKGTKYKPPLDENGKKIRKVHSWERVNRKEVMKDLGVEMINRLTNPKRLHETIPRLIAFSLDGLANKDIQMWFKDLELQNSARAHAWTGEVDTQWDGDYLFVVDANMGSLKSDYYVKRSIEHTVDFRGLGAEQNDPLVGRMVRYRTPALKERIMTGTYRAPRALATTRVTYTHAATKEDWDTKDYHSYTRMIVPADVQWIVREWFFPPSIDTEMFANRTVYNYKFDVLIGNPPMPTMLQYILPVSISEENYRFKVQKQSGIGTVPFTLMVIMRDGTKYIYETDLTHDMEIGIGDMIAQ